MSIQNKIDYSALLSFNEVSNVSVEQNSNPNTKQTTEKTCLVVQSNLELLTKSDDSLISGEIKFFDRDVIVQKIEEPLKTKKKFPFSIFPNQTILTSKNILCESLELEELSESELYTKPFYEDWVNLKWDDLYDKDNLFFCILMIKHAASKNKYLRIPEIIKDKLSECTCIKASCRNSTEKDVLVQVEKRFVNRNQKRVYVSVGSEGCFQDWVILSQLILLGFTNIDIHLCDMVYLKGSQKKACETMKEFFSHFPNVNFTVYIHGSLREFTELKTPADIVLALDFYGDLDKSPAPKVLFTPNGFAYCSSKVKSTPNWDVSDIKKEDNIFRQWTD